MALDPIVNSLDGLDESIASHYTATEDGQYRLDVSPSDGWALENVAALRTALESNKHKRGQLADQLSKFKNDDGELHDIQSLVEARQQLEELRSGKNDDIEDQIKQRLDLEKRRHAAELDAMKSTTTALESDLDHAVRVQTALNAIGEAGAAKFTKVLLGPVLENLAMQRGEDGKPRAVVVGPEGAPRLSPNDPTRDMGVGELLSEMSNDEAFAVMFGGSGASGSGAPQPGSGAGGTHRISAMDLQDQSKYQAAKQAAEAAGQPLQIIG